MTIYTTTFHNMIGCPLNRLDAAHYRVDGTCRCHEEGERQCTGCGEVITLAEYEAMESHGVDQRTADRYDVEAGDFHADCCPVPSCAVAVDA